MIPSLDFETYSAAGFAQDPDGRIRGVGPQGKGGLPVVGTPQYAAHPTTEILCASYDLHDGNGVRRWVLGTPAPRTLLDHVAAGGHVRAFNITFEWWLWNMVGVRKYGWPPLQLEQCHCDMAAARRFSLPGKLANVCKVLGTPGKDPEGDRLIKKLTRPHTPTKNRQDIRWTPATAWDDFVKLYEYCDQDVTAEDAASALIPPLTDSEREVWLTDQRVNARGVQVDVQTLDAALNILGQAEDRYNAELAELTGGAVVAASELAKLQDWLLRYHAVNMPNMQKATIETWLDRADAQLAELSYVNKLAHTGAPGVTPGPAHRALRIRRLLGSANIKKLHSLKLQVSSDGRLRDQYMYCGADRTGRWSAGGVQLQNLTGKGPGTVQCSECGEYFGEAVWKELGACSRCGQWAGNVSAGDWGAETAEQAVRDIQTGDLDTILRHWGDAPLDVLCGCLRAMFIAPPGRTLICVDFSAVEAVVAACLSRCQWRIDTFAEGKDIYLQSVGALTGVPYEQYQAYLTEHGTHHPDRKIGKVLELALGFGGWINAILAFGGEEYLDETDIKPTILAWRDASPEIVEMWGGQYRHVGPGQWDYAPELFGLEGAAIKAILTPGTYHSHIDITYAVFNDILYCRLPSGRFLHYHKPRLDLVSDKLNRGDSYQITFEGYNSDAAKGPRGWHRMDTFGGRLFENVVQAVARDLQAGAMVRADASGYPVVMHTHDELTAEVTEGQGSVDALVDIMTQRPEWAAWWPIRADGWAGERYKK